MPLYRIPYYGLLHRLCISVDLLNSLNPIGSDGGILVSATDMAKWIKFNLNLGKTESGVQLLDKKRMEEMRHVTTPLDQWYTTMTRPMYPVHDVTKGYGYAWFISEYRGEFTE